jgi:SagB-type dehydrogenase family enzyme
VVPSAGGLAATWAYAIVSNSAGPWNGRVIKYDPQRHAVHDLGAAPDRAELRHLFRLDGNSCPGIVVLIVGDLTELVRKYGPRGGRFLLLEAGHAAQNIGLRVAKAGLCGTELGSGLDDEVLDLLGLGHTGAVLATAYAVGR